MKSQTTINGVWEAQKGYAVMWRNDQREGSGWKVNSDLSVEHTDGPDSTKPPMHIRRTALSDRRQWTRGEGGDE
jgi:hypothetical protein